MKYIKITFFSLLILLTNFGNAQANLNGDLYFSAGISQGNAYKKLFNLDIKSDGIMQNQNQVSSLFPDFNFTYIFNFNKRKINPLAGVGYMQLGFLEKGNLNFNDTLYKYFFKFKSNYCNYFAGISYKFYEAKNTNFRIIQTLNLMQIMENYSNLKKFALAARTQIMLDHDFSSNFNLSFAVFIQNSLMKFNKKEINNIGQKFLPYSIGINIGTSFNTKKISK